MTKKTKLGVEQEPLLFVLRHKKTVLFLWLIFTIAGFLLSPGLGEKLDYTYSTPGQPGYEANLHIEKRFKIDPAFEPTIAVLKLPAGQSMYNDSVAAHWQRKPFMWQPHGIPTL